MQCLFTNGIPKTAIGFDEAMKHHSSKIVKLKTSLWN